MSNIYKIDFDINNFPSQKMIISKILFLLKNNIVFTNILKEYTKNGMKIFIFDEANITYNNILLNNYVQEKISNKKNVLSIIVSNKITKENSRKYMKKTKKLPFQLIIKKKNQKTNNIKIYIKIKTFSDVPIEKRVGIYEKLYNKYHELDDILLLSIYKNLIKYKPLLYSKDMYKDLKGKIVEPFSFI